MKNIVCATALAFGQLLAHGSYLGLIYPTIGEFLPGNGRNNIIWTNSADMTVGVYLNWYDTNGVWFTSNLLHIATLPEGTNSFLFYCPSNYPTEYLYKIELFGADAGTNVEDISDFVFITEPATFSGTIVNTNPWVPGQSKDITVSWTGFQNDDACKIIVEAPTLNRGGYGFLVTNLTVGSYSGTQTVSVPYPDSLAPAYQSESYTLMSGPHSFTLMNERCGIVQTFGQVEILTEGLQMSLDSGGTTSVTRGEHVVCAKVKLDATPVTNDVYVTEIGVVFTSYSDSWLSLKCRLKDGTNTLSTQTLGFNPYTSQLYDRLVTFPVNLTVSQGSTKELDLDCEVLPDSETGTFIWSTHNGDTNVWADVTASYLGGGSLDTSVVVPSAGSYMSIQEVESPKFVSWSNQGDTVTYEVLCKPQAPYLVLTSSDLTNWTGLFTTNGSDGTVWFSVPNLAGYHFFKMLETNSPPLEMAQGNQLLEIMNVNQSVSAMKITSTLESSRITADGQLMNGFWSLKHPEWPPLPANTLLFPTFTNDGKIYINDIGYRR